MPNPASVAVTAVSQADAQASGSAAVTLLQSSIAVSIAPPAASVPTGGAPAGSDLPVTASAINGLFPNMIELDLQLSSTTLPGVRMLFITTLNNDRGTPTGTLEVK